MEDEGDDANGANVPDVDIDVNDLDLPPGLTEE